MMLTRRLILAAALAGAAFTFSASPVAQVSPRLTAIAASSAGELRDWDRQIDARLRTGELRLRDQRDDPVTPGRAHERLDQYHDGVRVWGGDVARQIEDGVTVSIFGTVYHDVTADTEPAVSQDEAKGIVEALAGAELGPSREPELVILPLEAGYTLAWHARIFSKKDLTAYFIDARTGVVVDRYSDLKRQATVGLAYGVLGDQKKISVQPLGGAFVANDLLRPPALMTYDMRGDYLRTERYLNGLVTLSAVDFATDPDNTWTDGAAVDAHVYAGWTYDYYFKRFGRRGVDDRNRRLISLVHPIRRQDLFALFEDWSDFFVNAFWTGEEMVYGVGLPPGVLLGGQTFDHFSGALDIVAHELTHGVTDFTSRLIYRNESGALNEAFSDIMAAGAEFFFQSPGSGERRADYLIGEDVIKPGGIRSMANPNAFGDPDHYSLRFTGAEDNGGVHINSGIANHAFYLAIEGGTNRVSGLSVQGVGASNREQMEKVFYRAFVSLMPSNATFSIARAATIQAARDLYGAGSAAERAVTQAWAAVGVF